MQSSGKSMEKYPGRWAKISQEVFQGTRTYAQCRNRYTSSLDPKIKHGEWTLEEDEKLKQGVAKYPGQWVKISQEVFQGSRTLKQCETRFNLKIDPKIKQGEWTSEEDEKLKQGVVKYSGQWVKISQEFFQGTRTNFQCHERYNNKLDPKVKRGVWTSTEDEKLKQGVRQFPQTMDQNLS